MKRNTVVVAGLIAALVGAAAIPALSQATGQGWNAKGEGQGMMMGRDDDDDGYGRMGQGEGHGMRGGEHMHGDMERGGMGGHFMQGHGRMGQAGMMGALLKKFDTSGDGRISPDELRAGLTGELKQFDANGDGTLSLDEYAALYAEITHLNMVRHFQHLDTDGNGQITADEMTAPADRLQQMQKAWQGRQGTGQKGTGQGMGKQGTGQGGSGNGATGNN